MYMFYGFSEISIFRTHVIPPSDAILAVVGERIREKLEICTITLHVFSPY